MRGWALVLAPFLAAGTAAAQDAPYAATDLGTPSGASDSLAAAVNAAGDAAGRALTPAGFHAALWRSGEAPLDLGTFAGGTSSFATALNGSGEVVGQASGRVNLRRYRHAFRWTAETGLVDLGTLAGGSTSVANDVNDAGLVVGQSDDGFAFHAVAWSADGAIYDLGTLPGGSFSEALATNERGDIAGDSDGSFGPNTHATLWRADGTVLDLGTLPGLASSVANDVNGKGVVAGTASGFDAAGSFVSRAFVWSEAGGLTDLGAAFPEDDTVALALDESARVVGYRQTPAGATFAVLWETDGTPVELGALPGGAQSAAFDVNEAGQIVGQAQGVDPATQVSFFHAVRYEPTGGPPAAELPVADAGPDQVVACTGGDTLVRLDGSGSRSPSGAPLTYTWSEAGVVLSVSSEPEAQVAFGTGVHEVALVVSDGALDSEPDRVVVTVADDAGPACEASGAGGWSRGPVTVALRASDDCSGVAEVRWSLDGQPEEAAPGASASVEVSGDGVHELTFFAVDGAGNAGPRRSVEVRIDGSAPAVEASLAADGSGFAPNHKMVALRLSGRVVDPLSGPEGTVTVLLSSSEPDDAPGGGDGRTSGDVDGEDGHAQPVVRSAAVAADGSFSVDFRLRAERAGGGPGRTYTIVVAAADAAGNAATRTLTVLVPHDRRK